MKSKWSDYYKNITIIYLFEISFDPHCKLDNLIDYLKKLVYSLYDEYTKFYGLFLNLNFGEIEAPSTQAPTSQIDNVYQLFFFLKNKKNHEVPPYHHQHKVRPLNFKII